MLPETVRGCPLFAGIEPEEVERALHCLAAKWVNYEKDSFIFRAGAAAGLVGIVAAGGVNVIQEDFWGNRTILAHVGPGGLFGEAFACAGAAHLPVSVVATGPAQILLVDWRRTLAPTDGSCAFHPQLTGNMLRILAGKNIGLTQKMEQVSRRTTREKLLAFLSQQALDAGGSEVTIPFNRQELADYLFVERSALSRELGAMKRDGLLEYDKNWFKLL